jgi:hypothetical protein
MVVNPVNKPLVSIVNVSWNGKHLLERYLPSLALQDYPAYEVVVVDNASTDGSAEFVRRRYPAFRVIRNEENLGTAEGSNSAIPYARGEYIFWVSNDMRLAPDIVARLVARCEKDPSIGICTVKMLRMHDETATGEIDSVGSDLDIFGFPVARGIAQRDNGQFNQPAEVFFSFGGALFIRREALEEIGGFDGALFTLADDIDLCWRAHLAGWKVAVEPGAWLYHCVSATLGKSHSRAQKRYLSERNTLRMLVKNYSLPFLACILPAYLALLSCEILFFCILGKGAIARSLVEAVRWNIRNLVWTMAARRRVQGMRKVSDLRIVSLMLPRPEKIRIFFDFLFYYKDERWQAYF